MKRLLKIWTDVARPTEIYALECRYIDEIRAWKLAHLKLVKSQVELLGTKSSDSLEILLKNSKDIPCILLIAGKKVLSKTIHAKDASQEREQMLRMAFPSINRTELEFQIDKISLDSQVISAVRGEIVHGAIEEIRNHGRHLMDMAMGDYTHWQICTNMTGEEVNVEDYVKGVKETVDNNSEIGFLGYKINANEKSVFLFGLKMLGTGAYHSDSGDLQLSRENWKYKQLFNKGIYGAAAGFFMILMINFIFFSKYTESNGELSVSTLGYDAKMEELVQLQELYEGKKEFLQINGRQGINVAKMGDQIAQVLPSEMSLDQMTFYPVDKYLKKEKLWRYSRGNIVVRGSTDGYHFFSQWIEELRKLNWVGDIGILSYQESGNNKDAAFAIKIDVEDE